MVLILGKNGYVSSRFQDFFIYKKIDYKAVSLRNSPYELENILKEVKPRFVINTIGYTGNPNVDSCEDHKEECLYGNVIIAEIVADICRKNNIPLGFISSGCIYNEDEVEWWRTYSEKDFPNFSFYNKNQKCSWYSGSKALGENLVRKSWDRSYIFRLRMPFNHLESSKNYLTKIFSYNKVWSCSNSLTNIDEFVKAVYNAMNVEAPYGVYNVCNHGGVSAKEIHSLAKTYNIGKENYSYFKDLNEFSENIKTPRSNCVLNTNKIRAEGIYMSPVLESLEKTFSVWNQKESTIFW